MSYINYKSEENSIYICKGHSKLFDSLKSESQNENFETLTNNGYFSGIKINNFLSERELDGIKCEEEFKTLLEKNNVPFLYIGQGPYGIERSGVLIEQTKSKRADFILNLPDLGTLLIDVKCKTRFGFKSNDKKYFYLFVSELEALYNLQKLILMPVWVAFYDREWIHNGKNNPFYFLPISVLYKFWKKMYDCFDNETQFNEISVIRIPYELLTKVEDDKIFFKVGYSNIDEELLRTFAIKNIGFNRKLKDRIKQTIRENDCYKSNLTHLLLKDSEDFFIRSEVNLAIENLIAKNIIDYQPRKKLSLVGE
ncbi:hypothetical protein QP519_04500 [Weeksella virosa]|uniref:hypothetical protein n=1 Tax=Weeksella virosa TaxID=1014 RepID=UPI002552A419|nr:hypothetical protein [Weeksella virosa]MDK7374798.1 hypothetical protein [Weeksella virosa]